VSHYRCGAQMLINTALVKRQARQEVGCNNKMGSCLAVETNKPGVTTASATGPAADEVLVAAAKDGDEQAFGVLIERHHQRMLALALRYVRVREDAEDIVQQTFQKAFVYLHRFERRSAFSTGLTRIAINEALMLLRRGCGLREVSIDESSNGEQTSGDLELSDSSPDPEASCLRREAAGILSAAMHKLTPPVRTVIELRELEGLSTRETALRMGLSVGAVKARVFQGRRELRKTMESFEITAKAIFSN
jgi:RNA polymerase sigma-70 factor, ECF subfamily